MRLAFTIDDVDDAAEVAAAIDMLYKFMPRSQVAPGQGVQITVAGGEPGASFTVGAGAGTQLTVGAGTQLTVGAGGIAAQTVQQSEKAPPKDIVWARQQLKPFLDDPVGKQIAGQTLRSTKYGVTALDQVKDFEGFVRDVDVAFRAAKGQP